MSRVKKHWVRVCWVKAGRESLYFGAQVAYLRCVACRECQQGGKFGGQAVQAVGGGQCWW
jgi:hypothetical protein